jgi:hypothetical protein
MQGENRERWQKLCEQASSEQDPDVLMMFVKEIEKLLAGKEQRLRQRRAENLSQPDSGTLDLDGRSTNR